MNWTVFFSALVGCAGVVGLFFLLIGLGLAAAWVARKCGEGVGILFIVVAVSLLVATAGGLVVGGA